MNIDGPCESCQIVLAQVVCPAGDGSARLCFRCAHNVTEHEAEPGDAWVMRCRCARAVTPAAVPVDSGATGIDRGWREAPESPKAEPHGVERVVLTGKRRALINRTRAKNRAASRTLEGADDALDLG